MKQNLTRMRARSKRAEKNAETHRRRGAADQSVMFPPTLRRGMLAGQVRLCLLFVGFLSGGIYLFSINKTAVQGYSIRVAEKKVTTLAEENKRLRIREAELRSLYRIEAATVELNMLPIETVSYVEETGPIALK